MRKALAVASLTAAVTCGTLGLTTAPALAAAPGTTVTSTVIAQDAEVTEDDDDTTGRWGLAGLTGLLGLFD